MEVNKNIVITFTKEELTQLIIDKMSANYEVNPQNIVFADKRGNKVKLNKVVVTGAVELPDTPAEEEKSDKDE